MIYRKKTWEARIGDEHNEKHKLQINRGRKHNHVTSTYPWIPPDSKSVSYDPV